MPFNNKWLENPNYKPWLAEIDGEAYCNACERQLKTEHGTNGALNQHMLRIKHQENMKEYQLKTESNGFSSPKSLKENIPQASNWKLPTNASNSSSKKSETGNNSAATYSKLPCGSNDSRLSTSARDTFLAMATTRNQQDEVIAHGPFHHLASSSASHKRHGVIANASTSHQQDEDLRSGWYSPSASAITAHRQGNVVSPGHRSSTELVTRTHTQAEIARPGWRSVAAPVTPTALQSKVVKPVQWSPAVPSTSKRQHEHVSVQTSSEWTCLESLCQDFLIYLVNGVEPDVVLKCGDDTFPAHKSVLSARSSFFKNLFRDRSKNWKVSFEVTDMETGDVKQFLQYIYCGTLTNLSHDNAQRLYVAADKYAVEALKKKCGIFMLSNIRENDAFSLLVLADGHRDEQLKKRIISYIISNDQLMGKKNWSTFSGDHAVLSKEVHRAYTNRNLAL